MRLKYATIIGLIFLVAVSAPAARAETGPTSGLTLSQMVAVQQISSYLDKLVSLQGQFTQIDFRGRISRGLFNIQRPGKLRFEYAPPHPLLIVADGAWLAVTDRQHGRTDHYPLFATPLRLILAKNVNLLEQATVRAVNESENVTTITLADKKAAVPGMLILTLDNADWSLRQWVVVDIHGRRTTTVLENTVADVPQNPELFRIPPPKKSNSQLHDER